MNMRTDSAMYGMTEQRPETYTLIFRHALAPQMRRRGMKLGEGGAWVRRVSKSITWRECNLLTNL